MVTQLAYFRDKIHITVILPCPDLTDLLLFFNITRFTKTLLNKKSENEILTARQESREYYTLFIDLLCQLSRFRKYFPMNPEIFFKF